MDGKRAIEAFLEMMIVERSASTHTVVAYRHDLMSFFAYVNVEVECVSVHHVRKYVVDLNMLSARSVRRCMTVLRQFFMFCSHQGWVSQTPMDGVSAPKLEQSLPRILSEKEVQKLRSAAAGQPMSPQFFRNIAIVELLYATGMRVSELLGVRNHDIRHDEKMIKVLGKRSQERFVLVHDYAYKALMQHMASLPKGVLWLFPSPRKTSRAMTRQSVFLMLRHLAHVAAIPQAMISPHVLRHAFATHMLERGADLFTVQALLGHKSVASTQVYTHVQPTTIRALLHKHHPLGNGGV